MTNQQIENIEDINEAINPITPHINGSEGLEILGHNRNQSVNLLRFSRSFFKIYSHLTGLYSSIKSLTNGKEDKIVKNDAFNKNFGTNKGEVLEGHRMAQIQGVENFGGDVQTPGVKKAGYSYWCAANKDFYVCKVENSLNYIDNAYFDAFSNAALLGKFKNLSSLKSIVVSNSGVAPKSNWIFGVMRLRDIDSKFYWSTHIITPDAENWFVRYDGKAILQVGCRRADGTLRISQGTNTEYDYIRYYYYD